MESDTTEDNLNDSTIPIGAANELLRDLLYRRKHYEANCRHIAVRRDDLYKEIPINHLIPLAFHTSTSLLESLEHIDAAVQAVSKQYKSDIFSDWQKYCKALDTENRAVATFGMVIHFLPTYTNLSQRVQFFSRQKTFQIQTSEQLGSPRATVACVH